MKETDMTAPLPPAGQPVPVGVVVTGPNHVLHAVATLFTWPLCGGWAWVWLFIAANNRRTVHAIDAYGNVILTPEEIAAEEASRKRLLIFALVGFSILGLLVILAAIVG